MNNLKEYNGIKYYTLEDGSIGVYSIIDKNATDCTIPSEIDGIPVTSITNNAFSDCNNLQSCIIPEGITDISHHAFEKCYNLKSVEFPQSLTYIGDRAFNYCSSLIQVTIPENVETLGMFAFDNCSRLRHVRLENPRTDYTYAFPVYPNALLEKKNIKTRNVVNNIFAFQYSESEFTKFALMRDCNNIQIQHISGSVPHVYDIIRALKLQPDYLLNIPKRRYKFSILTNFSERGRGYYKLVYFKKPVDVQQGVIGAYSVGCKVEVNSTGKLEDWINKDFYINDLLDILYKATGDYNTTEIISKKVHTMEPHHTIEYDSSKSILDLDVD